MNEDVREEQREGSGVAEKELPQGRESAAVIKYTRRQTAVRILASLFFGMLVWGLLEIILFLVVVFQLVHALVVQKSSSVMTRFANRAIAYFYRIMRYLTFNEDRVPFPFSRFPEEIEKPAFE